MKIAVGDHVECRALPRRGLRGVVSEVITPQYVRVRWNGDDPEALEGKIEPVFWLRKLNLLEVLAEAASD